MMNIDFVWRVRVYNSFKTVCPELTKIFVNKLEAMEYVIEMEAKTHAGKKNKRAFYIAKIDKWSGE